MSNTRPLLALPVQRLRSEAHAQEKNDEMMRRLWQEAWFVEYRQQLTAYREHHGERPVYPSEAVEEVEQAVDAWMCERHPGYTR